MGDRGPQCTQTGPTGVGSSCPAHHRPSVCSVQIRSCQDPLGLQRLAGQDSPALPRAQQTGRPSPLPAAQPWAPSLHPGCTLQPPAGATPWLCGEGCAHCWAPHHGQCTHTRTPPLSHSAVAASLPGSQQTTLGTGTPALPTRGKCRGAPLPGSKTCPLGQAWSGSAVVHGENGGPQPCHGPPAWLASAQMAHGARAG